MNLLAKLTAPIEVQKTPPESSFKRNIRAGVGLLWCFGMNEIPNSFVDSISIVGFRLTAFSKLLNYPTLLKLFLRGNESIIFNTPNYPCLPLLNRPMIDAMDDESSLKSNDSK